MERIQWDHTYSVGHQLMDQQHQTIIDAINHCVALIEQGAVEESKIRALLNRLNQYAEEHFSAEEALLEEKGIFVLESQKLSHQVYQLKIEHYLTGALNDESLQSLIKFLNFWWMHHIQVEDMEYSRHL